MRIVLLLIFIALCGWLAYERSRLQDQLAVANSKLLLAQNELDKLKGGTRSWLAERIQNRTDLLNKPPQTTTQGYPAVHHPITPDPYLYGNGYIQR